MKNSVKAPLRAGRAVASWFDRFTIKGKLMSMMLIVTSVALVLVCTAMFTYQWFGYRSDLVEDGYTIARMLANNSTAALSFDDPVDAQKVLESLRSKDSIEYAAIYRNDGNKLAEYRRDTNVRVTEFVKFSGAFKRRHRFDDGGLHIHMPVILDGGALGEIYTQSDLNELSAYLRESFSTLAALVLVVFGVSFYLSNRMQKMVSQPLIAIAGVAKKVSSGDLSARVDVESNDEIGTLATAVNNMTMRLQEMVRDLQETLSDMNKTRKALQVSEERYRALYDDNPTMILTINRDMKVLSVNRNGAEMLGYRVDDMIDRPVRQFVYDEDIPSLLTNLRRCFTDRQDIHYWELRSQRSDGSVLWMRDTASVVSGADGEQMVLVVCEDISERKRAEESRKQLQDQLMHAQKMEAVGQLTGGIAHDFNNILLAIMGYADLAASRAKKSGDAVLLEYLQELTKGASRAAKLIQELLIYSRGGSAIPKPVSIAKVLTDTVGLLKASMPSSVQIRMDAVEKTSPIMIDPTQLTQVIMNLCINARDAMGEVGELKLALREFRVDKAPRATPFGATKGYANRIEICCCKGRHVGRYVEFSVTDSGSGIDRSVLDRMFEPFFSTKEVGKGTGMGLAVLHGVMQRAGGHIVVESDMQKGTVFRLLFRALDEAEEDIESVMPELDESSPVDTGGRVLLVDDEELVLNFMYDGLVGSGYQVTKCVRTDEVLELFQRDPWQYDLVITDQTMPVLTGAELATQLLAIRPGIPIVLCTGYSSLVDEAYAKKIGVRAFVTKPVRLNDLLKVVRQVLPVKQS